MTDKNIGHRFYLGKNFFTLIILLDIIKCDLNKLYSVGKSLLHGINCADIYIFMRRLQLTADGLTMTNRSIKRLYSCIAAFLTVTALLCGGVVRTAAVGSDAESCGSVSAVIYGEHGAAADMNTANTLTELGEIPKNVQIYAGGVPFGVKLFTNGLMIVGFSDVDCSAGSNTPAKDAGMKINDIIIKANDRKVEKAEDFIETVEASEGKAITVTYLRDNTEYKCKIIPSVSESDGKYKTGMWLRDSTAGIGTVTFVIPESGIFGGLGHGICDSETGSLVPMSHGITSGVIIEGIKKGVQGAPGELQGVFNGEKTGSLLRNTDNGVFGLFENAETAGNSLVSLGSKNDIKEGEAYILCTLDDNKVQKYSISISEIHKEISGNKCFVVTVTDKKLIEKTGGIVQGM